MPRRHTRRNKGSSSAGKCPPGLECLLPTSALIIHQQINVFEELTDFEEENTYVIYNDKKDVLLFAKEISNFCARCCISNLRPFQMKVFDVVNKREVLHLKRPFTIGCGLFWCSNEIQVYTGNGTFLGMVKQKPSITKDFTAYNASGDQIFIIQGLPCWQCCRVSFEIYARNKQVSVGRILKGWSGFMREMFTDADVFSITYPQDLDVKMKAVLLGAVFLYDFMFFEMRPCLCCW